jgi:hypothetical protein
MYTPHPDKGRAKLSKLGGRWGKSGRCQNGASFGLFKPHDFTKLVAFPGQKTS